MGEAFVVPPYFLVIIHKLINKEVGLKKLFLSLILLFLFAGVAPAQGPLTIFTNASSVGAYDAQWVKNNTIENWTCDIDITGSPSALTVRIEGNMGGDVFDPTGMAEHVVTATQLAAGKATFGIANSPVINIRGFIVSITGSGSISGQCGGIIL